MKNTSINKLQTVFLTAKCFHGTNGSHVAISLGCKWVHQHYHWMKNWICPKFAWCKYVANMKFAKLCNQCKGGNGRICTRTGKFSHCHTCTVCKASQSSYLQHICTRQIWCKFVFLSCVCDLGALGVNIMPQKILYVTLYEMFYD